MNLNLLTTNNKTRLNRKIFHRPCRQANDEQTKLILAISKLDAEGAKGNTNTPWPAKLNGWLAYYLFSVSVTSEPFAASVQAGVRLFGSCQMNDFLYQI